jgi:hypothetical protein
MSTSDPLAAAELRAILDAIREIRYGSVEIVIQDSRVVQIERREKTRFDLAGHGGQKLR